MSLTVLLKRLARAEFSLEDEEEEVEEDEDDDDDTGESTDKAVLAEVPASCSSSTAARFLPRPLACLDAAVVAFLLLDMGLRNQPIRYSFIKAWRAKRYKPWPTVGFPR